MNKAKSFQADDVTDEEGYFTKACLRDQSGSHILVKIGETCSENMFIL